MEQVQAVIASQRFEFSRNLVERALRNVLPEPVEDHYVVVNGLRYPPKQVVGMLTGLDRADFNTHQARHILRRLGLTVGRRTQGVSGNASVPGPLRARSAEADALRPFTGQWVAQRGQEVIVAASSPQEVVAWLERHDQRADAMFRVPLDEHEANGIAPA